jgi:thioredoxin-like negative regulator of GroEL
MVSREVIVVAACIGLLPATALAQDPSEGAATALFDEGMKLMERGRYSEACPKLARSHQLAPTGGTVLNLAECYEKNAQYSSAWTAFMQAAARAAGAGKKDFETLALERAKKLEPKLSRITLKVARPSDAMPAAISRSPSRSRTSPGTSSRRGIRRAARGST